MLVDIYLTDTETGFSKIYHDKYAWEDVDTDWPASAAIIYQYTEGNYSCDCNRSLFLYDWEENKVKSCGNTIRLDKIVDRETGKVIWDEPAQKKDSNQKFHDSTSGDYGRRGRIENMNRSHLKS
jgi:hypothetical protein